jgi:diguanylate cyclase (GGDEF)-like protein
MRLLAAKPFPWKTVLGVGALFVLPVTTLAAFALGGTRGEIPPATAHVLGMAAMVTAAYAVVLALHGVLADRRLRLLARDLASLRGREHDLLQRLYGQRIRIDFLTAAREVSLVLNQDVDFKAILERVLGITADLLGGKGSEEITIYLRTEEKGRLVPRARRREGAVHFDLDPDDTAPRLALSAYEHGRLIAATGGSALEIAIPLVADRELFGVLLARTPLDGEAEEKAEWANQLTAHLEEFAKVVALAIKTPDLYTRAVEDGLTKLATKRHFRSQLEIHAGLARRHGDPLALIMIDIDHFKRINDTYGHLTGDRILRGVAEVIQQNLRRTDSAAYSAYRYGGEEMSVILPKTDLARALEVAERLRRQIEARIFAGANREEIRITVSLGVATQTPAMTEIDHLVAAADEALYAAKKGGRNQVRQAGETPARAAAVAPAGHPPAGGPEEAPRTRRIKVRTDR